MTSLAQDVRYGLRVLRKSPGFTAVAVLTLALGIGANTAIFSLVNGILLAPLPYPDSQELVSITGTYPKGAVVAMQQQVHSMDVAAYAEGHEFNLTGDGEAVRLTGTPVSANLFSILGASPALGRVFALGEDHAGQDNYVILGYELWQRRFGGDPAIVGRVLQLEGMNRQVVGVMPADFRFPSRETQLWIPMPNDPTNQSAYWAGDFMPVIGRLHPGTTILQAQAEVRVFQSRVGKLFPWTMPAEWNAEVGVVSLRNGMVADVRARLLMLLAAVVLVLMIACANVANLVLSRAASREKEMSIRAALGAGRQRIVRQLLTESVLLAALGGALGLGLARLGLDLLKVWLPADTPRLAFVGLDWQVLVFTAAITVLTGIAFGFAPALQASRAGLADALKSGNRGNAISVAAGLRSSLAVGEVALAVLLVISAGLLIRSFWALSHVNPGFVPQHLVTARITPNQSFCRDRGRCLAFYRSLLDQVQAAPGVSGAALVNTLPLDGMVAKRSLEFAGLTTPPAKNLFWLNVVSPNYFQLMQIPLLAGQRFNLADESGNLPVAIVTATTARRFWPGENAVGRHVRFVGESEWRTVVGVIADVRAYDLQRNEPEWMAGSLYVPLSPKATVEGGELPSKMTIAVRTNAGESPTGDMLRLVAAGLNHDIPIGDVKTMSVVISDSISTPGSIAALFGVFAALALVLGMIGVYGVLAFLVSKRTREIGIRMALGARRSHVLWLVVREGAKFALSGISLGIIVALIAARGLASQLYGVSAADPWTYSGVAIAMALIALLACYVPVRRAMSVDPLISLRSE